ncbi:MAG: EF-hand domain-containing protein [Planctomycetota bacterium]|jgi:Ca2+-binding EF-hand superfamily protein
MRRTLTTLAITVALLLAFSASAFAGDDGQTPDRDKMREKIRERIKAGLQKLFNHFFEKADKNGDGVITADDLETREERIAKVDSDGDGQVTKEELAAFLKKHRKEMREKIIAHIKKRGEEKFNEADADGDGFISRDEFRGNDMLFDRMDADGDGQLSKGEIAAAVKKYFQYLKQRRAQRGMRFFRNMQDAK